jgi:histidinol-phosphate/aromatic aminotransferase/cobyric acid decarboxylase-like protein
MQEVDVLTEPDPVAGDVLLDWNESPLGPPESAVNRVVQAARQLHRYPRGVMEEVTALAAGYLRVPVEEVLLTSGVDEAVDLALSLAQRAWGVTPGFDGYEDRTTANGKPFHAIPLGPDWEPAGGVEQMTAGDIVFVAQPNNPTGNVFRPDWLAAVRQAAQYVFIDETYHEFSSVPSALGAARDRPGLLVYRSFSKAMGLAGIRLGCLVADVATIARLGQLRRFMPIDAVSLHAAAGVLQDPGFVRRMSDYVLAARPALAAVLRDSGLFRDVQDTQTNFVVAQLDPRTEVDVLARLGRAGIRVKLCDALGLPGWLRVSVGSWDDQRRLSFCLGRSDAD